MAEYAGGAAEGFDSCAMCALLTKNQCGGAKVVKYGCVFCVGMLFRRFSVDCCSASMPDESPLDPNRIEMNETEMQRFKRDIEELRARHEQQHQKKETETQTPMVDQFKPLKDDKSWGFNIEIKATSYELKPSLIRLIQSNQFGGKSTEDAYEHIDQFSELTDTIRIHEMPQDAIRLKLFTFSLRDRAKKWFRALDKSKITTWEELVCKFLFRFFPPSLTMKRMAEITSFSQLNGEPLSEAWERFRELLRRCPRHGFKIHQQLSHFYMGLNCDTMSFLDASCGGSFMDWNVGDALRIRGDISENGYHWPEESIAESENRDDLIMKIAKQIELMTVEKSNKVSSI